MDTIVSLSRRRGFVFPSSEIYGGLGSAYDYAHYGVLMKNNVKAAWLRAMCSESSVRPDEPAVADDDVASGAMDMRGSRSRPRKRATSCRRSRRTRATGRTCVTS